MIWTNLDALVALARRRAMRGIYDGRVSAANMDLMRVCAHNFEHPVRRDRAAMIILTRDSGHHTGGWWKNPDYELCWHLSLSQREPGSGRSAPTEKPFFAELADAFFGADTRLCWIEGPYSAEGRSRDVWHYRLFCNVAWQPILPRGEVYSRQFTELGWQSFSEIHGTPLSDVDAPFLTEGAG